MDIFIFFNFAIRNVFSMQKITLGIIHACIKIETRDKECDSLKYHNKIEIDQNHLLLFIFN